MKVPRIHTGSDGHSHWDEVEVKLEPGDGGWVSSLQAGSGVVFRSARHDAVMDWHTAPRRQDVVTLAGQVEYEIGDGTRRRFGPGSIFLADDRSGRGHASRGVGPVDRVSLYIPVDE
jgi:hypothetical protein